MYRSRSVGRVVHTDLIDEVEGKVLECVLKAQEFYGRKFSVPNIRFEVKGTCAGRANGFMVNFNVELLKRNRETFINQTVPHEVAHYIAVNQYGMQARGHGYYWKDVMYHLDVPAHRCHNYDVSEVKRKKTVRRVELQCSCQKHYITLARAAKYGSFTCKKCGTKCERTGKVKSVIL